MTTFPTLQTSSLGHLASRTILRQVLSANITKTILLSPFPLVVRGVLIGFCVGLRKKGGSYITVWKEFIVQLRSEKDNNSNNMSWPSAASADHLLDWARCHWKGILGAVAAATLARRVLVGAKQVPLFCRIVNVFSYDFFSTSLIDSFVSSWAGAGAVVCV